MHIDVTNRPRRGEVAVLLSANSKLSAQYHQMSWATPLMTVGYSETSTSYYDTVQTFLSQFN